MGECLQLAGLFFNFCYPVVSIVYCYTETSLQENK